jgi:protein-S-isoprenylcysteine O-methyltransferase
MIPNGTIENANDNDGDYNYHHSDRFFMAWTWCVYISAMCIFHLMEFFVTTLFNPTVVSSDSFLVNHSKPYTAAALLASTEFWIRFWWFPSSSSMTTTATTTSVSSSISWSCGWCWWSTGLGILLVAVSQVIRSAAMIQCGESFNHYIQTSKKDNHALVTNGIYEYLRHPSYVGFYYWSIGTQLVLNNRISTVLFALAGWSFFSRRIPYEEQSLVHLFGDEYYQYALRTYVGIPFISKRGLIPPDDNDDEDDDDNHGEKKEEEGVEQVYHRTDNQTYMNPSSTTCVDDATMATAGATTTIGKNLEDDNDNKKKTN